ncbi:ABC-type glycerol-3-phosphate transport system substrate-binding protein [Ruminiclostridium sufflavum DSM 19573]|uniref:ABC-type glycerol-3-phosphate transport system substrate-binding protein n=1 Tax=Ruminiclostridium sufflavum DSM 19573 TaxID=1121337 RepID=A0A318XGU1_9FIRM|nr:extracellular solute-binding protein [Ruminiclostridium sufflavum]PYG85765.1 ABC-type glycerol-3-phosphate transport system substrate-binding protein [Ruminiclostridium sufflavum DSM 19573]
MRRAISATLALVMLFTMVLAGCGNTVDNANNSSAQTSSSTAGTEVKNEKAVFWTWLSTQQPAIDKYNSMQDEVKIELVQMSHTDIAQKLLIALASGTGAPDMFQQPQRTFSNISKTGKLMDMTPYIQDSINKFSPAVTGLLTYEGKIYGMAPDVSPGVIWYRKDVFEQNGIGEIKTWNEFLAAGEKLKEKGLYIMPVFNPAGTWGANEIAMFMQSRGGNFFTEDGKVIKNNTELEFTLNWFNDALKNGIAEGLTFFTPEFWGEFKASKIVAWPMNIAEGANIKKNAPELSGKWDVMPFPKWDDKTETLTGYWGGTAIAIPEMSPVKEKVVKYAQWLCTTNEGQQAMYTSWGSVPSNNEALKDSFFSKGDEYFSGSNPLEKINDVKPFYYYDFSKVEAIVGEQVDLMFSGKQDAAATARNIENSIASATGR